jgi:AhpD family alkylhydroperoxidase
MPRIAWVTDQEATGSVADVFSEIRETSGSGKIPNVLRTMSLRPDFLRATVQALKLHYEDGALTRTQHEMIASYVAALTQTNVCLLNHTRVLEKQGLRHFIAGQSQEGDEAERLRQQGTRYMTTARALREGSLDAADVSPAERLLLEFVGTLTRNPSHVSDEQVDELRVAGWSDEQIAEAVYDAALFNMMVRIVGAFGLHPSAEATST